MNFDNEDNDPNCQLDNNTEFNGDNSRCCNCKRKQFDDSTNSIYHMYFHIVSSRDIKKFGHACQFIQKYVTDRTVIDYNLCNECYHFLYNKRMDFKYIWPGFWWKTLSGRHSSNFNPFQPYYKIKSGQHLWKTVPFSIRKLWIEAIKTITLNDSYPYIDCDLTTPKSIFIDQIEYCFIF